MSSQLDLDQGGTFRQQQRIWMGPSIGWQLAPANVVLPVTATGTTTVQIGNTLVTVNYNGTGVVIQLPPAAGSAVGPGAIPGTWIPTPITVVDIGGFASTVNTITLVPYGTERIDGLTSIVIDSPYAAYTLRPNLTSGGWTLSQ